MSAKPQSTLHASPLRYPGGKAWFTPILRKVISRNGLSDVSYFEPFAGGAGAALQLLFNDEVERVFLNDADRRIFAFWDSVLLDNERFLEKLRETPVTIAEWHIQREIYTEGKENSPFDLGFATFFLNRCNRSGVIKGGGPIGGLAQEGKYLISARFNKEGLEKRIVRVQHYADRISFSCMDAIDFLKAKLPKGAERAKSLAYIDPPYVLQGKRLYLDTLEERNHLLLSRYLRSQNVLPWVLSYDKHPLIEQAYSDCNVGRISAEYSLSRRRKACELVITPTYLKLGHTDSTLV